MDRRNGTPSLRAVLDIAENALTVAQLVTANTWSPDPNMSVDQARGMMLERNFNAAPVNDHPPYRFIDIDDLNVGAGVIDDLAKPIEVSLLVTASLSLTDAIVALKRHPFYFVLEGNTLLGIVTRSELQRPAVSMVTFSISLAAEAGLTELVGRWYGPEWLSSLPSTRREKVNDIFEDRRRSNAEISLLESMMLEDRLYLVGKHSDLRQQLGFESGNKFDAWATTLKSLRNTLAHGGDLLDAEPDPVAAISLFERLRGFAEAVERLVDTVNI